MPVVPIYQTAAVAAAEQLWSKQQQQPTWVLMQRAALATCELICTNYPKRRPVVCLCGPGNNGGDGMLVAVALKALGWPVQVWLGQAPRAGSDAERAYTELLESGIEPISTEAALPRQALWVDALLGAGMEGAPRGRIAELIRWLKQQAQGPRVAIDVPTGLAANTGAVADPECVLAANHTLVMIGHKQGLFTGQGLAFSGHIHCADLGASAALPSTQAGLLSADELCWPKRQLTTHKGAQGHVLLVGGEQGMWGAGILSAQAALVAGAGRVSAYIQTGGHAALLARVPEVMTPCQRVPEAWLPGQTLVLGPGLGRSHEAGQFVQACLALQPPARALCVLDADALWHLPKLAPAARSHWVLTPHPGEAARLLDTTVAAIEADRFAAAAAIQARWGGVVVLKGAGTIVCAENAIRVLPMASSALATSGLGDVLAGVIGALGAQGLSPFAAACTGTFWVTHTACKRGSGQPVVRATEVLDDLAPTSHMLGFSTQQRG